MGTIGRIDIALTASTAQLAADLSKSHREVEEFVNKSNNTMKGFLKDLKGDLGKGSLLGQSLKIAAGGGAIAGLTFAGRELEEFASKVNDINKMWKEGDASVGDMVETIARGIPIAGAFWSAGREIRDIFTGEKADLQAMVDETMKLTAGMNAAAKATAIFKAEVAASHDVLTASARRANETAALAAMGGLDKSIAAIHFATTDAKDQAMKRMMESSHDDLIKSLEGQIRNNGIEPALRSSLQLELNQLLKNRTMLSEDYKNFVKALDNQDVAQVAEVVKNSRAKIESSLQNLHDEYSALMGHEKTPARQLADFIHANPGIDSNDISNAKDWIDMIEGAKEYNEVQERIKTKAQEMKSLMEQFATPLERYQGMLEKANQIAKMGNEILAQRMRIAATKDLLSAYRPNDDPGISDARTTRFNLAPPTPRRSSGGGLADIAKLIQQQRAVQDKQYYEAQQTNINLRQNGIDVVEIAP